MFRSVLVAALVVFAAPAGAGEGLFSLTADHLTAPVRPSGLTLLGCGTAATLLAEDLERPEQEVHFLEWAPFEPVSDIGNGFGSGEFALGSALAIWGAGRLSGRSQWSALGRDLTATFVATGIWSGLLKAAVAERRPDGGRWSFPSGHTAVAFGMATTLHRHLGPRWGLLAYTAATMTAAARMEDNRHYARDVAFGAALGMAVGGLELPVSRWFRGFGVSSRGVSYSKQF